MIRFDKSDLQETKLALFSESMHVRFQDVDAAGVVFFARFFDYVHQGYEGLLRKVGVDLPGVLRSKEWAAPLRHVEADYRSPAFFGDLLAIELVAAEVEESEISLGWRLTCQSGDRSRVVAVVQSVHTFIDPGTRQRCPLPASIRDGLGSLKLAALSSG